MDETIVERKRLKMHEELVELLGSNNVYFNAPSGMSYPCIRYEVSTMDIRKADNIIYKFKTCYLVTLIEYDVTSNLYLRVMNHFQYCNWGGRPYDVNGLRHTPLLIYI